MLLQGFNYVRVFTFTPSSDPYGTEIELFSHWLQKFTLSF